jgi:hypothetical protein
VFLDLSEETMFCVSGRMVSPDTSRNTEHSLLRYVRDYVLCLWTYLRRVCSVFLDVSEETMFCVSGRIQGDYVTQNIVSSDTSRNAKHSLLRYVQ